MKLCDLDYFDYFDYFDSKRLSFVSKVLFVLPQKSYGLLWVLCFCGDFASPSSFTKRKNSRMPGAYDTAFTISLCFHTLLQSVLFASKDRLSQVEKFCFAMPERRSED